MRSISRVADVSINTVSKLLIDAGKACAAFHDEKVRGVSTRRCQVDEIWSFTAAKQKNVARMKKPVEGAGDSRLAKFQTETLPSVACPRYSFKVARNSPSRSRKNRHRSPGRGGRCGLIKTVSPGLAAGSMLSPWTMTP